MATPKGIKKPVTGNRFKAEKVAEQRQRQSGSRPDGVFDLNDDIHGYRRKRANIDGVQKHNYDGNISFDTADTLGEEIAALRTRK